MKRKKKKLRFFGFTIIELLVVIIILGLLVTMAIVITGNIRRRATDSVIAYQLVEIKRGIERLAYDTGALPAGCNSIGILDTEVALNDVQAGLVYKPNVGSTGTDCGWSIDEVEAWQGPYITRSIDPWGKSFWYDPDYWPRRDCPSNDPYPGNPAYAALLSTGPNGFGGPPPDLNYDCDDIFILLKDGEFANL